MLTTTGLMLCGTPWMVTLSAAEVAVHGLSWGEHNMTAPSAMFVEAAVDTLKNPDYQKQHAAMLMEQDKQVRSALPGRDEGFYSGYALGMMTARVLLMGMPNAVQHRVEI